MALSGKPLYYSFAACESTGTHKADKCVKILSQDLCVAEAECSFTEAGCESNVNRLDSARLTVDCSTESSTTFTTRSTADINSVGLAVCSPVRGIQIADAMFLICLL